MRVSIDCKAVNQQLAKLDSYAQRVGAVSSALKALRSEMNTGVYSIESRLSAIIVSAQNEEASIRALLQDGESILHEYLLCESKLAKQNLDGSEQGVAQTSSSTNRDYGETATDVDVAKLGKERHALWNYAHDDGGTVTELGAIGYTKDGDDISAYLFDIQGHSNDEFLNGVTAATTVGVTIGAAYATSGCSFTPFSLSKKTESKTGGKYDSKDANDPYGGVKELDGSVKTKDSVDLVGASVAASVGVTVAMLNYNTKIGTDKYYGTVDANAKILNADAEVTAKVGIGNDGVTAKVKAEVGASLAEVEGSASVSIAGVETKATVSAEIGLSVSGELGYDAETRELSLGVGLAIGVGGKVNIKIKVPDLGLPWW